MPLDPRILRQLKHPDSAERRKAITALANSRDREAIEAVEEVSRMDDDPKVRALAVKAVDHLRKYGQDAATPNKQTMRVSEKAMERGRTYVEEAMNFIIAKDNGRAAKSLSKALETDPSLKADPYFLSMVSSVFGSSDEEALEMLRSGQKRGEFIQQSKKSAVEQRRTAHKAEASELGWNAAAFDLIIYGLISAVITFLTPFVVFQLITNILNNPAMMEAQQSSGQQLVMPEEFARVSSSVQGAGVVVILISAVVGAVLSILGLLLFYGVVHLAATRLFRGVGTLPYMLTQVVPQYSIFTAVSFLMFCIMLALMGQGAGVIGALCLIPIALGGAFIFLIRVPQRIGAAYDSGLGLGCLSSLVAYLLIGGASALISYVFVGPAASSLVDSLMRGGMPLP